MKALELLIYFRQLKRLSKKEAEGRGVELLERIGLLE